MKLAFVAEAVNCGADGFAASATACNEGRVSIAGFRFSPRPSLPDHMGRCPKLVGIRALGPLNPSVLFFTAFGIRQRRSPNQSHLIAEQCEGVMRATYHWGPDLSESLQGAGGVGGLVLMRAHWNGQATESYVPGYDGNGNVVTLWNSATGTQAAQYEYGPFGELLKATGPAAEANPFRFSTKYTDGETGLVYYGYRYYAPNLGRWINRDPIEERGGVNLFGFVSNNSMRHIDVLGEDQLDIPDGNHSVPADIDILTKEAILVARIQSGCDDEDAMKSARNKEAPMADKKSDRCPEKCPYLDRFNTGELSGQTGEVEVYNWKQDGHFAVNNSASIGIPLPGGANVVLEFKENQVYHYGGAGHLVVKWSATYRESRCFCRNYSASNINGYSAKDYSCNTKVKECMSFKYELVTKWKQLTVLFPTGDKYDLSIAGGSLGKVRVGWR